MAFFARYFHRFNGGSASLIEADWKIFPPLSAKNKKNLLPLEILAPPFFLSSFLRSFRRFLYFTSFDSNRTHPKRR